MSETVSGMAPDKSRRQLLKLGAGAAVVAGLGVSGLLAYERFNVTEELVSHYHPGALPADDPLSSLWRKIAPRILVLAPQQMAVPFLKAASVKNVIVKSINNGKEIVFYLEWEDKGSNQVEMIDRFRDAVAVQLPLQEGPVPPITMGSPSAPVYLVHWKASWQADVDKGQVQGAKDNYPNLFQDVVPDQVFEGEAVKVFYPARAAGNPYARSERKSPLEEIVAQGFGTAAGLDGQDVTGKGVFQKDRWKVAISLPMNGGKGRPVITPGKPQPVAFAVWNGGDHNVGGRKHFVSWQPVDVREV